MLHVIPAQAGIAPYKFYSFNKWDSRLRGNDGENILHPFNLEILNTAYCSLFTSHNLPLATYHSLSIFAA